MSTRARAARSVPARGVVLLLLAGAARRVAADPPGDRRALVSAAERQGVPWPAGLPAAGPVVLPRGHRRVSTADELTAALADAGPGTVIALADGTYDGQVHRVGERHGRAADLAVRRRDAVLRGPGTDNGVVLHLQQVAHWRLVGFTVREGQKGVMADGVSASVVQDLTVTEIGDEAVHLRTASTGNVSAG